MANRHHRLTFKEAVYVLLDNCQPTKRRQEARRVLLERAHDVKIVTLRSRVYRSNKATIEKVVHDSHEEEWIKNVVSSTPTIDITLTKWLEGRTIGSISDDGIVEGITLSIDDAEEMIFTTDAIGFTVMSLGSQLIIDRSWWLPSLTRLPRA